VTLQPAWSPSGGRKDVFALMPFIKRRVRWSPAVATFVVVASSTSSLLLASVPAHGLVGELAPGEIPLLVVFMCAVDPHAHSRLPAPSRRQPKLAC
jgi:hypothetical protein